MLTSPGGLAKIASWAPALEILIQPVPGGGLNWPFHPSQEAAFLGLH